MSRVQHTTGLLLLGYLFLGGTLFAQRAEGQTYRSWRMAKYASTIAFSKAPAGHGDVNSFSNAPAIPPSNSALWQPAPSATRITYRKASRHCGTQTECLKAGDFVHFRTTVTFPKNYTLSSLKIRAWAVDDGIRITIFNSRYPNGVVPAGAGYLALSDMRTTGTWMGSGETKDIASYFVMGEANDVVITLLDDCCASMVLEYAEFLVNAKVVPFNQLPVFLTQPIPYAVVGKAYSYTFRASDPDGDALTYTLEAPNTTAILDVATKTIKWTPPASAVGQDWPFTIKVCDSKGECTEQSWKLLVTSSTRNNAPRITSTPVYLAKSLRMYRYVVKGEDPDVWDVLTYRLKKGPSSATIEADTGILTWTPDASLKETTHFFTVEVCDLEGACVEQTWEMLVGIHQPPVIATTPGDAAVAGIPYVYVPSLWQPEKDLKYTWTLKLGPTVYFFPSSGKLQWNVKPSDVGTPMNFKIEVCDPFGACASQSWKVNVVSKSTTLAIRSTPGEYVLQGDTYTYQIDVTIPTGGNIKLTSGPTGATLKNEVLSWTPGAADVDKSFPFELEYCDAVKLCQTQRWTVRVLPNNRPPEFSSKPAEAIVATTKYTYKAVAVDPDLHDKYVFYVLQNGPGGASLNMLTGDITWSTQASDSGKKIPWEVLACDLQLSCRSQLWTLTLSGALAIASTPPTSAKEEVLYTYQPVVQNAPTALTPTWKLTSSAQGAKIDVSTGQVSWTPPVGSGGQTKDFGVEVCYTAALCAKQAWKVQVFESAKNLPPTILSVPDAYANVDATYLYVLKATDPDSSGALSYTLNVKPDGASVNENTIQWKVTTAHAGKRVLFVAEVCDDKGACARQEWNVEVLSSEKKSNTSNHPTTYCPPGLTCTTECPSGYCPSETKQDVINKENGQAYQSAEPTGPSIIMPGCACSATGEGFDFFNWAPILLFWFLFWGFHSRYLLRWIGLPLSQD